ncbi:SDR family NAD(P)-dependent oxidoreductase [Cupriavidus sp. CuC1]|uniref:SDR family NAD(P)-dependent oxidoreductase n=1 Tax=Cupriavidus sp. CuC1 TaxID=3373131 RepID=UPI0037D7E0AB
MAIVTGGAAGIGAATVAAFLQEGACVVCADIRRPALTREHSDNYSFVEVDVSEPESAKRAVAAAIDRFGSVDILVNSAGTGVLEDSEELTPESWRRTLSVNLDGSFYMCQEAIRPMLNAGRGAIVNVASIYGHVGFSRHAAYAASKAGVVNMTRSLGIEYASRGIRINAICPGFIGTSTVNVGMSVGQLPKWVKLHPIRRSEKTEEVVAPILFLASDEAGFMVGASLIVDGGYTAQ